MKKEICNAYTELNDPVVQRERFQQQASVNYHIRHFHKHTNHTLGGRGLTRNVCFSQIMKISISIFNPWLTLPAIRRYRVLYFSFQPVLHDWGNKGHGMCYPVCGMVHIKEPLLLIRKSSPCGDSGFPLSLSEWSSTIILCQTPYNRK